jgi:hypothetical protein
MQVPTQTVSATPRDCVVVFRMPELPETFAVAIVTTKAIHNVQSGLWYRTSHSSFTEASKRAAHYSRKTEAFVLPATRYVLDRWMELPVTGEMTRYLYRRSAPQVPLNVLIRRRCNPN